MPPADRRCQRMGTIRTRMGRRDHARTADTTQAATATAAATNDTLRSQERNLCHPVYFANPTQLNGFRTPIP